MNRDLEEKVIRFLRTMAEEDNWHYYQNNDIGINSLEWTRESYDPLYVAQDLLDQLPEDE